MPANTLREELAGIVTSSHYGGQEDDGWTDEELTEAVDAILSAVQARLPKEKPKIIDVQDTLHRNVGYNTCLQDVKQALDIESEGASNG